MHNASHYAISDTLEYEACIQSKFLNISKIQQHLSLGTQFYRPVGIKLNYACNANVANVCKKCTVDIMNIFDIQMSDERFPFDRWASYLSRKPNNSFRNIKYIN